MPIELLHAGIHPTKRAKVHHLRTALRARPTSTSGPATPRAARELFRRVATGDEPEFVDVQARDPRPAAEGRPRTGGPGRAFVLPWALRRRNDGE